MNPEQTKPAVIIPCHNRKEITLNCFTILEKQGVLEDFQTILVDDGSTDGTAEEMKKRFPQVEILTGDGNLFWTGAIELGMRHAFEAGASSFIWLNDDSTVARSAIDAITQRAETLGGIVSGQGKVEIKSQDFEWYFPIMMKGKNRLSLNDVDLSKEEIPADTCRGNLVAVSRKVVEKIGFPDGRGVPHYGGDTDYGLRATKAKLPLHILTKALVIEEGLIRDDNESWLLGNKTIGQILKTIFSKRSNRYPPMVFIYNTRHWGIRGFFTALLTYVKLAGILTLKVFTPRALRIRLFGKHSTAWKSLEVMREDASS
ncbi:MAG: glycosyltransferase family 2 protein [Akkermansiaceae bacterium]